MNLVHVNNKFIFYHFPPNEYRVTHGAAVCKRDRSAHLFSADMYQGPYNKTLFHITGRAFYCLFKEVRKIMLLLIVFRMKGIK